MTRITWRRLYPDQAPGFTQLTSGLRDFHQNNNLSWDHWHIDTGNILLAMVTKTFYTFQSKPDCPQALTVHCHSGNTDTDSTDSISFIRSLQTDRKTDRGRERQTRLGDWQRVLVVVLYVWSLLNIPRADVGVSCTPHYHHTPSYAKHKPLLQPVCQQPSDQHHVTTPVSANIQHLQLN